MVLTCFSMTHYYLQASQGLSGSVLTFFSDGQVSLTPPRPSIHSPNQGCVSQIYAITAWNVFLELGKLSHQIRHPNQQGLGDGHKSRASR